MDLVGNHTRKLKSIHDSLLNFVNESRATPPCSRPCQLFLGNPKTGHRGKITELDLKASAELIHNFSLPVFVHAAYCINLSDPIGKKDPSDTQWALGLLKEDLKTTCQLGGRGVVVHVGKSKTQSVEAAAQKMFDSIREVLPFATEDCPLLLETPAGQGTELLVTIEEFVSFYKRFSDDDQKVFKLCVDTQHVFSAGYDPFQYLQTFTDIFGVASVPLIHLNDSDVPQGACADRHKRLGTGHIPIKTLEQVIEWASARQIPMVIE